MPRIPRDSYQTSFFHIIVQGIKKEYIFNEKKFLESYRNLLISYEEKSEIKLLSYCIMNNHAHILIYTDSTEKMSNYMKCINTIFATYYNTENKRVGYVFRNRFKSEPIYDESYLINCISYIHNNPVKAKMVESPEQYKYSSYNDYINEKGIVTPEKLELLFGKNKLNIDDFKLMHLKKINSYKYEDYDKETEEIINEFLEEHNKTFEEVKDSKKLTIDLILELKRNKKTNIEIGKIFEIARWKVSEIYEKNEDALSQMKKI